MAKTVRVGLLFNYAFSFYRDVLRGVRRFAETRPDWIFMPVLPERRHLHWRGDAAPDGLLATVNNLTYLQIVRNWKRPIVNVSTMLPDLPYPRVGVDNVAVGRLAAQHLLDRGLQHFAFVGHPQHLFSLEREAGFCAMVREAGYEVTCYHTHRDRPTEPLSPQWFLDHDVRRWLTAIEKPCGLFVPGDLLGAEIAGMCQQLHVRIPDEISLVGVDNDELYCELARPPLSSVVVNAERVGYEAGALLDRLLSGRAPPSSPILVQPCRVYARQSSDLLALDDQDVVAAVRFIRDKSHLPISVIDVLKAVPLSRRALERRFRQALGRGIAEEICRVRLERCKRLLAETDINMAAVARHAGFSSARHLATTFRRETGISPSEFRRQTRRTGQSP